MKSRKKLYIVTVFILILIFVLSLLIETLFLKSLTEDDYNSLIDYSDYTVTYPYILDTNKNELIIGIDYKYVEKHFKKNLILIAILVDLLLVMGFETFNFKKTNKI